MASKAIVFISGKISWAKILGNPVENYNKDGREWTFELEPDEASIQTLIKNGLEDRLKGKGYKIGMKGQFADRTPFIQFKKPEFTKDGTLNKPIRLYDADDNDWDPKLNEKGLPTNLVGNESTADVKLDVRDYGPGKMKGMYPAAIRITDHVEYVSTEFGNFGKEDDAPAAKPKGKAPKGFGLDDEVPF